MCKVFVHFADLFIVDCLRSVSHDSQQFAQTAQGEGTKS